MKTLLVFLLVVLSGVLYAQDATNTLTWQLYVSDSLKTTRDTVDVAWGSERYEQDAYMISIYSSAADTITVKAQDEAGNWVTIGLWSILTDAGLVETSIITTTAYVKWYLIDPYVKTIRLIDPTAGDETSNTYFTVSTRRIP
jgi:hypothetical protein